MKFFVGAVLAVAMMVASVRPSSAQDEVSAGIKVGVNFADLDLSEDGTVEENESQQRKTGVVVGGFVDVPVNELFSFQPEFLYTQKGTKFEDEFEDDNQELVSFEGSISIDQIQIPLLGRAKFPGMQVRPFVVFGPAIGITTRAKVKSDVDGEENEVDIKDDVKAFEVSLIVGGGVQFGAGSVEVRYDHGLTNLSDDDDEEFDLAIKSRTFSILFGWSF